MTASLPTIVTPKPFIKWAGGKTQLLPAIESHLPMGFSNQKDITYIEPFVGGGALLFHLLHTYPNITRAVINDINPHLINAYRVIKEQPEELISILSEMQTKYHSLQNQELQKEYFLQIRQKFNEKALSIEEDAAYMIFLNRTCFNGLYRENSKGAFNVAFGKYQKPGICDASLIRLNSVVLQKVEILQGDFSQIESYTDGNTFIYFDPPYRPINPASFTAYSKENFNDKEQIRLKEFFKRMSDKGCRLLLSNSDGSAIDPNNTYLDQLYEEFIISRVFARRSISRDASTRGPIPELLIRNYTETQGAKN